MPGAAAVGDAAPGQEPKANLVVIGDFNEGEPVGSDSQALAVLFQAKPPMVDSLSTPQFSAPHIRRRTIDHEPAVKSTWNRTGCAWHSRFPSRPRSPNRVRIVVCPEPRIAPR
jgi:hypothetical protein